MKFVKKPVEIEAIQWVGWNEREIQRWIAETHGHAADSPDAQQQYGATYFYALDEDDRGDDPDITAVIYDKLHSTWVGVKNQQWIICGVKKELYPIDPEVLEETYTPKETGFEFMPRTEIGFVQKNDS